MGERTIIILTFVAFASVTSPNSPSWAQTDDVEGLYREGAAGEASACSANPHCPGVGVPSQPGTCAGRLRTVDGMEVLAIIGFVSGRLTATASAGSLGTVRSAGRGRPLGTVPSHHSSPGFAGIA